MRLKPGGITLVIAEDMQMKVQGHFGRDRQIWGSQQHLTAQPTLSQIGRGHQHPVPAKVLPPHVAICVRPFATNHCQGTEREALLRTQLTSYEPLHARHTNKHWLDIAIAAIASCQPLRICSADYTPKRDKRPRWKSLRRKPHPRAVGCSAYAQAQSDNGSSASRCENQGSSANVGEGERKLTA